MKNRIKVFIALSITLIFANGLYAQHDNGHEINNYQHHNKNHDNHGHKNHLAFSVGAATIFDHHITAGAIGLEYEYRIGKFLGIGLAGEYVLGETTEIVIGMPVYIHPTKKLKFIAAPLIIFAENHVDSHDVHDTHGTTEDVKKRNTSFAIRAGLGYDFHIKRFTVGPTANVVFGKSTALVYGVSIGMGF